jgi:hypothetical protein
MGIGNGPEFADATDGAEVEETGQGLAKAFIADMEAGAEVGACERSLGEGREDPLIERVGNRGTRGVVVDRPFEGVAGGEDVEVRVAVSL